MGRVEADGAFIFRLRALLVAQQLGDQCGSKGPVTFGVAVTTIAPSGELFDQLIGSSRSDGVVDIEKPPYRAVRMRFAQGFDTLRDVSAGSVGSNAASQREHGPDCWAADGTSCFDALHGGLRAHRRQSRAGCSAQRCRLFLPEQQGHERIRRGRILVEQCGEGHPIRWRKRGRPGHRRRLGHGLDVIRLDGPKGHQSLSNGRVRA